MTHTTIDAVANNATTVPLPDFSQGDKYNIRISNTSFVGLYRRSLPNGTLEFASMSTGVPSLQQINPYHISHCSEPDKTMTVSSRRNPGMLGSQRAEVANFLTAYAHQNNS